MVLPVDAVLVLCAASSATPAGTDAVTAQLAVIPLTWILNLVLVSYGRRGASVLGSSGVMVWTSVPQGTFVVMLCHQEGRAVRRDEKQMHQLNFDLREKLLKVKQPTQAVFDAVMSELATDTLAWAREGREAEFVPHAATWLNRRIHAGKFMTEEEPDAV